MPLPVAMVPLLKAAELRRILSHPANQLPLPGGPRPGRLHDQFFTACDCDDPGTMQRARNIVRGALEFNIGQAGTADMIRNTHEAAQRTEPGAVQAWRALRRAYKEIKR